MITYDWLKSNGFSVEEFETFFPSARKIAHIKSKCFKFVIEVSIPSVALMTMETGEQAIKNLFNGKNPSLPMGVSVKYNYLARYQMASRFNMSREEFIRLFQTQNSKLGKTLWG